MGSQHIDNCQYEIIHRFAGVSSVERRGRWTTPGRIHARGWCLYDAV